jgi:hypothetical protein
MAKKATQTRAERMRCAILGNGGNYRREEMVTSAGIKVTVHIPDSVQGRQRKINQIYDILAPVGKNA